LQNSIDNFCFGTDDLALFLRGNRIVRFKWAVARAALLHSFRRRRAVWACACLIFGDAAVSSCRSSSRQNPWFTKSFHACPAVTQTSPRYRRKIQLEKNSRRVSIPAVRTTMLFPRWGNGSIINVFHLQPFRGGLLCHGCGPSLRSAAPCSLSAMPNKAIASFTHEAPHGYDADRFAGPSSLVPNTAARRRVSIGTSYRFFASCTDLPREDRAERPFLK